MTRVSMILFGAVLSTPVLTGCGRSDVPAAASTPTTPPKNLNIVRIPSDSPQLKEIRVEPVQQADMPTDELVAPGRVAMNPSRVSRVLPPVGGRVLTVLVKFGDHVEQGQALLTMDSPDSEAAVSAYLQAESAERQTKAARLRMFPVVGDADGHRSGCWASSPQPFPGGRDELAVADALDG